MTPTPIAIQCAPASALGFDPTRSHIAMKARPTTLRNDSIVSTSQSAARTSFARTSDRPSAIAAAMRGLAGARMREADRDEFMADTVDAGPQRWRRALRRWLSY